MSELEKRGDIPVNALLENGEIVFPMEHSRLREGLDPEAKWLTDAEIAQILRVVCGDMRRAIIRCILSMQQKAHIAKDAEETIRLRYMQMKVDAGAINV
jgi:hypothetical protein